MRWTKKYDGEFNKVTYGPLFAPPASEERMEPQLDIDCSHFTVDSEVAEDGTIKCLICGATGTVRWHA